jgi:hypothetical protein
MSLTFDERMDALEALMTRVANDASDLATDDEIDAVVTQIFDETIQDLRDRTTALKNNLDIVERTISTANG